MGIMAMRAYVSVVLCFALASYAAGELVVDVMRFGAKPDGKTDSTAAFLHAWQATCKTPSLLGAKLLVPKGDFVVSSMFFAGPCPLVKGGITIQVEGNILAPMDPSEYVNGDWLFFQDLNGVKVTGGGTFNARGYSMWPNYVNCDDKASDPNCRPLPNTFQFYNVKGALVENVKSVDAIGHDVYISQSEDITFQGFTMTASAGTPNPVDAIRVMPSSKNIKAAQTTVHHGTLCVSLVRGPADSAFAKSNCI